MAPCWICCHISHTPQADITPIDPTGSFELSFNSPYPFTHFISPIAAYSLTSAVPMTPAATVESMPQKKVKSEHVIWITEEEFALAAFLVEHKAEGSNNVNFKMGIWKAAADGLSKMHSNSVKKEWHSAKNKYTWVHCPIPCWKCVDCFYSSRIDILLFTCSKTSLNLHEMKSMVLIFKKMVKLYGMSILGDYNDYLSSTILITFKKLPYFVTRVDCSIMIC